MLVYGCALLPKIMYILNMNDTLTVKKHPSLNILVREDGAIFNCERKKGTANWEYGTLFKIGYRYVNINRKSYLVHRLVAEAFLPNESNLPCVDHINRDRTDNKVSNLRWVSYHENNMNTPRNDKCMETYGMNSIDNKKEYKLLQLRKWRSEHKDKVSEQNHRNHVRNYERRKLENADKIKAYRKHINETTKHVRLANGKRKRLPNAEAAELLKLPVCQRFINEV